MIININQTISNTLNEDRELIRTRTNEFFVLYPEEGKKLKNKVTGEILDGFIIIEARDSKDNYEEVDA